FVYWRGTVYQGFLDTQDYHRWHAPVNGYYRQGGDDTSLIASPEISILPLLKHPSQAQAWMTRMRATRTLVFINSDNSAIVGLAEMSSCEATVKPGQRVKAEEQLGMFHFGGSSCALVFNKDVKMNFPEEIEEDSHQKVNSVIAVA
ncbi:hypothetical protein WG66_005885, partial [Moniliophthora roreri]